MTFGKNLARIRRSAGLSQEQLAARLGLKRQNQVSAYEKGLRRPRPETVERYAKALSCRPGDLLEGVVDPYLALVVGEGGPVRIAPPADSPITMRARRLFARLSDDGQKEAVHLLASLARAYPRQLEPAQASTPVRKTEARARRAHSKR